MTMISPEEARELESLYSAHAEAAKRATDAIRSHGMDSPQFLDADTVAGEAWTRIRAILGKTGRHWTGG